jgi:YVTN family beta-propeller protein
MKPTLVLLTLIAALALAVAGCSDDPAQPDAAADKLAGARTPDNGSRNAGHAVVANRASGTISIIDARTAELVDTVALPQEGGDATPEPMYVSHSAIAGRVFVGDRANDRVAIFDADTFAPVGTVPAGQGVFHQWGNPTGRQLWVNNDIDNTITVIDPVSLDVLATILLPGDLVAMGGKPHDVVLDHRDRWAYVTMLGLAGPSDYLVQYDTSTFLEIGRQPVGKDPHVAIGVGTDLYVACQNTDQVLVFAPDDLAMVAMLPVAGAHGAAISGDGRRFYTTNLPGGGMGAIYTIDTSTNRQLRYPVDTPYPVPHNLLATPDGKLLFVTHSGGTADKVSVYALKGLTRQPVLMGDLTVGLNPFGIGYVY